MSQQVGYLGTVARAFSAVDNDRTMSTSLREKLSRVAISREALDSDTRETRQGTTSSVVRDWLWDALRHQLQDPRAAQRLTPLRVSPNIRMPDSAGREDDLCEGEAWTEPNIANDQRIFYADADEDDFGKEDYFFQTDSEDIDEDRLLFHEANEDLEGKYLFSSGDEGIEQDSFIFQSSSHGQSSAQRRSPERETVRGDPTALEETSFFFQSDDDLLEDALLFHGE
ncbi:MAG: hypothetical protein M1825_000741 [Sarcosagium campestre]|nr:MAG: hypothetical protein M1825_000741 [Sarcosagium campestre]